MQIKHLFLTLQIVAFIQFDAFASPNIVNNTSPSGVFVMEFLKKSYPNVFGEGLKSVEVMWDQGLPACEFQHDPYSNLLRASPYVFSRCTKLDVIDEMFFTLFAFENRRVLLSSPTFLYLAKKSKFELNNLEVFENVTKDLAGQYAKVMSEVRTQSPAQCHDDYLTVSFSNLLNTDLPICGQVDRKLSRINFLEYADTEFGPVMRLRSCTKNECDEENDYFLLIDKKDDQTELSLSGKIQHYFGKLMGQNQPGELKLVKATDFLNSLANRRSIKRNLILSSQQVRRFLVVINRLLSDHFKSTSRVVGMGEVMSMGLNVHFHVSSSSTAVEFTNELLRLELIRPLKAKNADQTPDSPAVAAASHLPKTANPKIEAANVPVNEPHPLQIRVAPTPELKQILVTITSFISQSQNVQTSGQWSRLSRQERLSGIEVGNTLLANLNKYEEKARRSYDVALANYLAEAEQRDDVADLREEAEKYSLYNPIGKVLFEEWSALEKPARELQQTINELYSRLDD